MAKRRGNGEGSVYRRKDGLWVGQYKIEAPNGTKKTKYIYAKTRKDAAKRLTEAMAERDKGIVYDSEGLTLERYLSRWLGSVEGTNRTSHWRFDTSSNVAQKRGLHSWLLRKLYETNAYFDLKRLSSYRLMSLIEEWEGNNGKGFTEGKVRIGEHPGKIPDTQAHPVYSVNDDDREWVLPFRGPVLGYDKAKDAHFVVYVPVAWETIGGLAVGESYLWLRPEMGDYILAYGKRNQTLEKINWPGRSQGRDVRDVVESHAQGPDRRIAPRSHQCHGGISERCFYST